MGKQTFSILFCISLLCVLGGNSLYAQTSPVKETMRLDLHFGGRFIHRATGEIGENIDFLDYMYGGSGNSTYGLMSIGFSLSPNENWTFDTKINLLSDLLPNQMQTQVSRRIRSINPTWDWGVKARIYLYPQYLDEFNQFHILKDTGLIADLSHNYRQRSLYDLGISAMPYLKYKSRRLQAFFASGLGLASFIPFGEVVTQKKPNANFRREIRYQTLYKAALTSHTDVEATFDLLRNSRISFGLLVRAELLLSYRNLPYERTLYTWTEENVVVNKIKPKNRLYAKSELSGGLFFKF